MARIKYYYDTETCKYERIKVSKWDIFLNSLGILSLSLVMAVAILFISSTYFESPQVSLLKKENKELLTYLLFYGTDEVSYIEKVKEEIQLQFQEINTSTYYFIKKSVRKILRNTKRSNYSLAKG